MNNETHRNSSGGSTVADIAIKAHERTQQRKSQALQYVTGENCCWQASKPDKRPLLISPPLQSARKAASELKRALSVNQDTKFEGAYSHDDRVCVMSAALTDEYLAQLVQIGPDALKESFALQEKDRQTER